MKRCVSSFVTADGRAVAAGELVEDSDSVIKGREVFFAGMEVSVADAEKPTPEVDETSTDGDGEINSPPHVDERAALREAEEKAEQDDDEGEGDEDRSDHVHVETPVEQATAVPGEKRSTGRNRK